MKRVIGLTGGMGSGKSAVAVSLAEGLAASRLDVDRICRELLMPGAKGWCAVREAFGARYFSRDETLDRPLLRREIFSDSKVRAQLNHLLHPLVHEVMTSRIAQLTRDDPLALVVVEVPLLFEAEWEDFFAAVVVVYASARVCIERLIRRDGLTIAEARQAAASQWPVFDKAMRADHVIDNSGCWSATCLQILHLARLMGAEY